MAVHGYELPNRGRLIKKLTALVSVLFLFVFLLNRITVTEADNNLLCNGGFESGTDDCWDVDRTGELVTPGYSGSHAFRSEQSPSGVAAWAGIRQKVDVIAGHYYDLRAWLQWQNAAQVHIKIVWLSATNNVLSTTFIVNGIDGDSGGWIRKSEFVQAPADAVMAELHIWHGVANGVTNVAGSTVWIDDVAFVPLDTAPVETSLPLPRVWHIIWPGDATADNLGKLKGMGFDAVYKCVGAANWNMVEAVEDQYDWTELHQCLDAAQQANMWVIPEIPFNVPPQWFLDEYPHAVLRDSRGYIAPSNARDIPYLLSPWFVASGQADPYLLPFVNSFLDVVDDYPNVAGVMVGNFLLNSLPHCVGPADACQESDKFTYWPVFDEYALSDYTATFGAEVRPPETWDEYEGLSLAEQHQYKEWLASAFADALRDRYLPWFSSYSSWKVINAPIWNEEDVRSSVFTTMTPMMTSIKQDAIAATSAEHIIINDDNMGDCGLHEQQQWDVLLAHNNGFLVFGERVPDACSWNSLWSHWQSLEPRPDGFVNIEIETTEVYWIHQFSQYYEDAPSPLDKSMFLPAVVKE